MAYFDVSQKETPPDKLSEEGEGFARSIRESGEMGNSGTTEN